MPTYLNVPDVGVINFPDTMSAEDIQATVQKNLQSWRQQFGQQQQSQPQAPEPSFTDNLKTAIANTGRLAIEPIRAIGQSVGAVGGLTAALAKDVMAGNVLPSTRRPGLMPDLQNVGAFLQQEPQPADHELTPVQKGIASGARILPTAALAGLGAMAGIPPSVSWPALSGSETLAETGSPVAALTSAGIAAVVPGLQKAGMEGAARVTSNLIKRFAEATTGSAEQGVAQGLIKSTAAQKAIELTVGNAAAQSFMAGMQLPEFLDAPPDKKQELLASYVTQGIGLSLLQLPYFSGKTLSETQKLIADDVPFMMNQMYSSPTTIDLLAREGFNPLKAQEFVETPPKLLPEGGISYAARNRQQQESDQFQRGRIDPGIQEQGPDRNVPPAEPQSSGGPSVSDSLQQSGQVPQEAQAVAPVLAPTLEENLAAQGITPASDAPTIEAAIAQLHGTVQKQLDAGVPVPPTLEAQLGVVEKPVAPFKYYVQDKRTGEYVPMFAIPKGTGTTQGTADQVQAAGLVLPVQVPPVSQENLISAKPFPAHASFPNTGIGSPADAYGAIYGPTLDAATINQFKSKIGDVFKIPSSPGTTTTVKIKPSMIWIETSQPVPGNISEQEVGVAYLKIRSNGTTVLDASKHGRPIDKLAADSLISLLGQGNIEKQAKVETPPQLGVVEKPVAPFKYYVEDKRTGEYVPMFSIPKGTGTTQGTADQVQAAGLVLPVQVPPASQENLISATPLRGEVAPTNVETQKQGQVQVAPVTPPAVEAMPPQVPTVETPAAQAKSLSGAPIPGEMPTQLVDSQSLIDQALSIGGGDAALKALVPNVRIRYGPLAPGVPAKYGSGVITLNKKVIDFIATKWPDRAQEMIDYLMAHELTHAVADTVLTAHDYVGIALELSPEERKKVVEGRPYIGEKTDPGQILFHIGAEYFADHILNNEQAKPIDPNSSFGQRILAALQKIWDYLMAALKRFGGKNPLIEEALAKVRAAKADVLAGKTPTFDAGEALNAKAISDMLKSYPEMTAEEKAAERAGREIGRPTAAQAMGLAKAGEVLAAHPVVRQVVAATQQAAAIQPTTPEERHLRDVARGILADPIVSKHLAEPVAMLDAAMEMADGDLATFEDVLRDPASTDEMKGAAAGNAKDTLMAYDESAAHFLTKYTTDREALMQRLQKGAETEFDAAAARNVAGTLFKQFRELGQQIVDQTADQSARSALKQAEDHSATSMKVLKFLSTTGILDGLTHDDNRSIRDLMGYIQRYMLENRTDFPLGTTPDTVVTENIGVGLDAIRDVLNIVRLSEPLLTAISESKNLASGEHYKAPLNEIKDKVLDAISKGNLEAAHNLYEKGIVAQGITLKESRDVANFYARDTGKVLTAIRSLDGAKAIIDALQKDPALARQRKQVYDFLNIREITHSVGATNIKFKSTVEGEPDTKIVWEGTPENYAANQKAARELLGDYASYIAMADAGEPGYSPAKAAGLKQSAKELNDYTDPAVDIRRGTLMPGGPAKMTEYLGSFVNHPELVPKYLLPRLAGPMGEMVNKTAVAFSDVKERPANLAMNLAGKRRLLLRAALDSHGGMRPWQYRKLVFNPTVASMQNFSDPGQLRAGDPIGNGQRVTREDLAYIDHIRSFQNEVFATVNNYGKHRFAATARGFAGILFDKNGMVRFPYARGPRMLSRRFPSDLVTTIGPGWRAATTPEAKAAFIDSHLTDVLLSYVRGVNSSDYGRPYKYRLPFKQAIREFEDKPLTTFDDLADRVTTLVNQDPDQTAVTRETVRDDLLQEIGGFIESGMKVAEDGAREDQKNPKVHITVIGGNNEMNSPREQAILPPGMYDYGIVDEGELASFLRDAAISFGNAHLESANAFLAELTRIIQEYRNEARNRNVPISTVYKESHEAMLKAQQRYSLRAAESLKEVLDAYVTRTENEIRDSANPWMKERPHQVVTNPIMRAVITSIVSPLKPFFRNFAGGGQQIVILNKIMRNLSWPHALASGGKQMINGAIKEMAYLGARTTHPGAERWKKFLEDPRGRAAVSGIAKAFMDVVHERQDLRDLQLELGTTTNANIGDRLRGQWAFASTGGRVSYDEPGRARRIVNRLATMLNMYSEALGSTFLGYADARLNGVGPYTAQQVVKDMKATALAWGDKLGPNGLYPDEALSSGWGGWGSSNQAAQLRQMWRTNGWGVLDRTLSEYYNKVMAARAQETQRGLAPGTLEDKIELLTPEQTNQLYVGIPEDVNMPTRQSRPGFWKSNPVLQPFGWLLQWGTTWLQKLLGLTQVLNNQPFLKRHGAILPLMISVGILIAIMATMQTEISSRVIGRMIEGKVTNFPTLFDAVTPGQAASAALAATADTIPIYGDALNMLTGTGFKRGFDVNSTFLLMNLASDVMKTSKEIYQSGAIGRPLLQFASRYTYPFNQLSARFPLVSGLRDLTNARNILTMGASGTGLETKLRKPGGGISEQNYTASTPLINDAINAIGNGDMEGFQQAYNALVDQKRRSGNLNPETAAQTALKARNPVTSVFGTKPSPQELEQVFANLPADLAGRARETIDRYNRAIGSLPTKTRATRPGQTVRATNQRAGLFRRPKLRMPSLRLHRPVLRRTVV